MIDLETAARELTASVADLPPDLPKVQRIARRRQRRRRTVLGVAAIVLLAGTAAALSVAGRNDEPSQAVHTTRPPASRIVDVGLLRFTVPDGWAIQDDSGGGCGGPKDIVVGEVSPIVHCSAMPGIRIVPLVTSTAEGPTRTYHGIPTQEVDPATKDVGPRAVQLPSVSLTMEFAIGVDPEILLSTIEPSARKVALTDVVNGAEPDWEQHPSAWQDVSLGQVSIKVPAGWPTTDRTDPRARVGDSCTAWALEGPSVAVGSGPGTGCNLPALGAPIDGAWLLPLAGTTAETRSAAVEPHDIGGTPVRTFPGDGRILEVAVPEAGMLVRIALGRDGHTAGSILASIRLDGTDEIALPCGPVVTEERRSLDLPADLNVGVLPGMGGGDGAADGSCAVNLMDPSTPGRHITFVDGTLAYALGDGERHIDGPRPVIWGAIEDGWAAQLPAVDPADTIAVTAYGVTEAEFEALLQSLADG